MKRFVIILLLMFFIGTFFMKKVSSIEIPNDAIRIRVIASSDYYNDQEIKRVVKNELQEYLFTLLKDVKDAKKASDLIEENLNNINDIVKNTLIKNNYKQSFDINFGLNYFPKKVYKGVEYKKGYYKSLVVTLGSGKGHNWWCVLFPPLCLLEAEKTDDYTNTEYQLYIKKILKKFKN